MEVLASTRIVLWEGGSLWRVDATPAASRTTQATDSHAHHALQIVVGLGGRFRLSTGDAVVADQPVAVEADRQHWFEAEGAFALLFIEPESRIGRAVTQRLAFEGGLALIDPALVEAFVGAARGVDDLDALVSAGKDLSLVLAGDVRAGVLDYRVRRVVAWAQSNMGRPIGLAEAAPVAELSAGRLRHLFVEQTGLPFKTYLLWLRLGRALAAAVSGASLTQAAHEAGFADSPHFSRTFRRMFGVAPASLRMT